MDGQKEGVFVSHFLHNGLNNALRAARRLLLTPKECGHCLAFTFQRFGWKDGGRLLEKVFFRNNLTHIVSGILELLVLDVRRDCTHRHK